MFQMSCSYGRERIAERVMENDGEYFDKFIYLYILYQFFYCNKKLQKIGTNFCTNLIK